MIIFFIQLILSFVNFFQVFHELPHGQGAVRYLVFHLRAELGEGVGVAVGAEHGVVAEAFRAVAFGGDFAVDDAFESDWL